MATTPAGASGAAYDRLHALIVSGRLAPGSPLVERDLCARLGVSRTPVRAALLRLQQDGLVVVPVVGRRPGPRRDPAAGPSTRGAGRTLVAPLTADDLRDVFLMAGAFEAIATRAASDLAPARRARIAASLRKANREFGAAVRWRPPDFAAAERHHREFHRASIAELAGPRLRLEFGALEPLVERYERIYGAATLYAVDDFTAAHDAIAAAVQAGDAVAAERAVGADWRLSADRHAEMVVMLGERGTW